MVRAAVPEAPVHEYCDLRRSEDDVCRSANPKQRARGHSVAQAARVEQTAQRELRSSIARAIRLHVRSPAWRGGPRLCRWSAGSLNSASGHCHSQILASRFDRRRRSRRGDRPSHHVGCQSPVEGEQRSAIMRKTDGFVWATATECWRHSEVIRKSVHGFGRRRHGDRGILARQRP